MFPQAIYISRITEGGAAAKDGKLLVGDRVISVSTVQYFVAGQADYYSMINYKLLCCIL